jgi:hypothetical protein
MKAGYAHLADTVRTSADRMATAPDGSIWLGAATPGPERSAWDRAIGRVDGLTDGRLGVALIIAVALAALACFRGPPSPPRRAPTRDQRLTPGRPEAGGAGRRRRPVRFNPEFGRPPRHQMPL